LWKNTIESKYGLWKSIEQVNSNNRESRWCKDLRSICGECDKGK